MFSSKSTTESSTKLKMLQCRKGSGGGLLHHLAQAIQIEGLSERGRSKLPEAVRVSCECTMIGTHQDHRDCGHQLIGAELSKHHQSSLTVAWGLKVEEDDRWQNPADQLDRITNISTGEDGIALARQHQLDEFQEPWIIINHNHVLHHGADHTARVGPCCDEGQDSHRRADLLHVSWHEIDSTSAEIQHGVFHGCW